MPYSIKPSIGMIPISDLDKVMRAQGFMKELQNSDIEKITSITIDELTTPGITNPSLIAVCAGAKNPNSTIDRETIKNALNLNGIPADEYLNNTDKLELNASINQFNTSKSDEVKLLRDELYNLKAELVRSGHLEDTIVGDGYIDGFKNSNIKYNEDYTDLTAINGSKVTQAHHIFSEKDWLISSTVSTDSSGSQEILNNLAVVSSAFGDDLVLETIVPELNASTSTLRKTLGSYVKSSYSFSKIDEESPSITEKYIILNDDTNVVTKNINKGSYGFATTIKIPQKCINYKPTGYLVRFSVDGEMYGNPGALTCYVFKDDGTDFTQLKYVDIKATALATSTPVTSLNSDKELVFNFLNTTNAISESYPEITSDSYCFVIMADTASESDYWKIKFGQKAFASSDGSFDLETNNKTFYYTDNVLGSFVKTENDTDLLYTVATKEKEINVETPYTVGLYTTFQPIRLSSPIKASRARLTLEVNKEGNLITNTTGTVTARQTFINLLNSNKNGPSQKVINDNDTLIIDNIITKAVSTQKDRLCIDKSIYLDSAVSIYRCGYEAQLKTYTMNEDTHDIDSSSIVVRQLNLVAVVPSGRPLTSPKSDRLIFEVNIDDIKDVNNNIISFNRAELQIKWTSNLDKNLLKSELNNSNDCVGRIYSLSLAFDNID
jgi:hypothetical protein